MIRILDATDAAKEFYHTSDNVNLWQPEGNELVINANDITIHYGRVSINIDKAGIDKLDVIEINGVRFVRDDN